MDTQSRLIEEFEQLKGQHILNHGDYKVWRLVAVGLADDYYYILWDGRKFRWETSVGRICPLKNNIPDENYNEFNRMAKINHYDQCLPNGIELTKMELYSKVNLVWGPPELNPNGEKHTLVSGPCWDLN